MSSIYEHLSKADIKIQPEAPELELPIAPERPDRLKFPKPPRFRGLKALAGAAVFLSIAACGISGYLFWSAAQESTRRSALEARYEQLAGAVQTFTARETEQRLALERFREELNRLQSGSTEIRKDVNRSRIEISNLEKKLLTMEDRSKEMQEAIRLLRQPPVRISPEVPEVTAATEEPVFSAPITAPARSTAAPVQPVQPAPRDERASGSAADAQAPRVPQVMTVNRKFDFVVVNLGSRDNLRMGDRLEVLQKGKAIATVEVEKLYDNFAAATIVEERKNAQIQEGDSIRKL